MFVDECFYLSQLEVREDIIMINVIKEINIISMIIELRILLNKLKAS